MPSPKNKCLECFHAQTSHTKNQCRSCDRKTEICPLYLSGAPPQSANEAAKREPEPSGSDSSMVWECGDCDATGEDQDSFTAHMEHHDHEGITTPAPLSPPQADQQDEDAPTPWFGAEALYEDHGVNLEADGAPIGGHRNPTGEYEALTVVRRRSGDEWDGVYKIAHDDHNVAALNNDGNFLDQMEGSGFTPIVLSKGASWQRHEDLGESDEHPHDGEAFRHNMIHLLWELRRRGIRHGDLTSANIILDDDWPFAIDFAEAHMIGQKAPQKSPFSDTHLILRTLKDWPDDSGVADTPRIARRWAAVTGDCAPASDLTLPLLGKRFLDLGCYLGDHVALAACEGMDAYGIDAGGFRTGENSIDIGRELWSFMEEEEQFPGRVTLNQRDIMDLNTFTHDIVLMFSTWSYLVRDYDLAKARAKLAEIIDDCGTLYFENQLFGDGPGPAIFQTDDDIVTLLVQCGAGEVRKLSTIPVWGRPASRTVFAVES